MQKLSLTWNRTSNLTCGMSLFWGFSLFFFNTCVFSFNISPSNSAWIDLMEGRLTHGELRALDPSLPAAWLALAPHPRISY